MATQSNEAHYALVSVVADSLRFEVIDERTKRIVSKVSYSNGKKFIGDIPKKYNQKIKAVTLVVHSFEASGFPNNLEFCKAVRARFIQYKIPHFFISEKDLMFGSVLLAANVTVNVGEFIILAMATEEHVVIMDCQFTENGYQKLLQRHSSYEQYNENHQFLSSVFKPKYIIVVPMSVGAGKKVKGIFKSDNLVLLDVKSEVKFNEKNIVEMGKWILDRSNVKFHLLPTTEFKYRIAYKLAQPIITAPISEPLPLTEFNEVPNIGMEFLLTREIDESDKAVLYSFSFDKPGHRQKITLNIDEQHFPSHEIEPIEMKLLSAIPDHINGIVRMGCNEFLNAKIPVIAFYDSSSIICLSKENGYEFSKEWNGSYGKQLLISFANKKPTFCEDALEDLRAKPSSVIFDLTRIMCKDPDEVVDEPGWGFRITKDSNNPVLLEFDSYDGSKKAASPAFLLAMLLRQHLKAIESETGEKPNSVLFLIFNYPSKEERDRHMDGLHEASELLKLDCNYIQITPQ